MNLRLNYLLNEMKQPLISVILPVYNGELTIKKTIESLLNQTYIEFELLICIDGGFDNSEEIIHQFNDTRIKIIKNETNLGLGPTLNKLIFNVSENSKYIAIAEQDDIYVPDRLKLQFDIMENMPEIGIVSGIACFVSDKSKSFFPGLLVNGNQFPQGKEMFKYTYTNQIKVVNSCLMIRKSIHIEAGMYFSKHHPSISIDWLYILRFSLVSNIYGINKTLVYINRKSTNKSVTSNKTIQFNAARKLIKDLMYEYPELLNRRDYNKAMWTQRKLELGQKSVVGFGWYSVFYFLRTFDFYFIERLWNRVDRKIRITNKNR